MESVLVLGGNGALGSHIVNRLLDEGHATKVCVLDVNVNSPLRHSKAEYHQGDISKPEDVAAVVQQVNPEVIFHTVSPKLMGNSSAGFQFYEKINVEGTENVITALSALPKGKRRVLVYTSSSGVVHNQYTDLDRVTEDLPLCFAPEQTEHYSHTKAKAEVLIREANNKDETNLLTATLRGCLLYGESDMTFTPPIVSSAKAGRMRYQIGDGRNLVDACYLGNAAHAHILAAQALLRESGQDPGSVPDEVRINGETFVITDDETWPFWDLTRAVGAAAGYPVRKEDIWIIPARAYYFMMVALEWYTWLSSFGRRKSKMDRRMVRYLTMTRTFDISKAKKRLGYHPIVGVQEGIDRAAKWYLQQTGSGDTK